MSYKNKLKHKMSYRNIKTRNGLTSVYNNNTNLLKLGGILTENTNIDIPNYYFSITGLNSGGSFKLDEASSLWNLNSGIATLSLGSTDINSGAFSTITTTPISYQLQVNDNISNISGIVIEPYYINQAVTDGTYSSTFLQSAFTITLSAQDNLGNTSSMEINPITINFQKGTVYSMWHNQVTATIDTREDIFLCQSGSTVTIGDVNMIHGRVLTFKDKFNDASGSPITIIPNTGATIDFLSAYTINKDFGSVSMVYDQYTNRWYTISRDQSITADNGLTINPTNNIQLGGSLIQNTSIETLDYDFKIEGTDPGLGFIQGLSINANTNIAKLYSTTQNSLLGWDSSLNKLMIQSGSLQNVTITNDGTNNVILDPTVFSVAHNTYILNQVNDGAGHFANLAMDNVEIGISFTNFSTGSSATTTVGQGSWNAGYQLANISTITLDDLKSQLMYQNGATPELSRVILETNKFTIDNTDGTTIASITGDAAINNLTSKIINVTNDESSIIIQLSSVDILSSINGGNSSTLSVTPDIIFAEGGMGFGYTTLSLVDTTLPIKKTFYLIDTTGANGTFLLTIPIENCIAGYVMTIKDSTGNASNRIINIDTASGQMELGLTQTINTNFGYMTFVYDGSTWLQVAIG